ncbi:MAG: hypothetical protein ACXABY_00570 [Candidatus Thorarchaeota archaeon]|jgi:hypothetical protein
MMYNSTTGIAWLLPQRTASRSTKAVLEDHGYVICGPGHHIVEHEMLTQCNRVVCNVRHPLDLLVSWWGVGSPENQRPFDEWLLEEFLKCKGAAYGATMEDPHDTTKPFSLFRRWTKHATELVRFETLKADIERVLGTSIGELPVIADRVRLGKDKHWSEFYTPAAMEAVLRKLGSEIKELGYSLG